jgi:hypothetical protein
MTGTGIAGISTGMAGICLGIPGMSRHTAGTGIEIMTAGMGMGTKVKFFI